MRTMNAFGSVGLCIVEEIGTEGSVRITANGDLTRAEAQELTAWLTGHLRETADNVPRQIELPLEWKDGSARS